MARFILMRLMHSIPLLIAIIALILLMLQLIPGDPVQAMVGDYPVSPAFREAITKQYHLDDPFPTRLLSYFTNLVQGDFGYSYQFQRPVLDLILTHAPRTILLTVTGFAFAIPVGILIGLISGTTPNRRTDHLVTTASLLVYAIPSFWLGQILVLGLSVKLGWFPTQGMQPMISRAQGFDWFLERVHYIALPALAFAVHEGTRFARIMRASVIDTLSQGYIMTARAKGLSRSSIIRKHVLRNSSLPLVTIAGYAFGTALGGAVLLETVFAWPGLGLLFVQAVRMRDNMTVVAVVIFAAIAIILINLIVDVLYALLDPRIRSRA
ncbi:ABC transporter permease [Seohaeicola zhoushanensis]|uniref:ABC transporter permease n=1 Tax=Seohaeicola zhoushanensis TaxID=1569283 RepID=A0A8J3MAL8_9RHOB|nr:ABC transporter permease [Seohaeicola zhoushanensis]GHF70733.1 ABC transporter permease [Seohaeicola zhoushanensis]